MYAAISTTIPKASRNLLISLDLHMLHTDPAFQRRGAGKSRLEWGTTKADESGLPIYLESSHAGVGLYKRHGFEEIDSFELDLGKYGGSGVYRSPLMIRKPKATV